MKTISASQKWKRANKLHVAEYTRIYNHAHPEMMQRMYYKQYYGISLDFVKAMLDKQKHSNKCNTDLAAIENEEFLHDALLYLEATK